MKKPLKFQLIMPWNNLGCLGIKIGDFYADMFVRPYWGVYVGWPYRRWYKMPFFKRLK